MRILVTGGAGFIASHFIDHVLKTTDWEIIILDRFTYAANGLARLKEIGAYDNPRVKIHVADISKPLGKCLEREIGPVDFLLHMAAGTHVDRSIACPREFVESNIFGSFEMLEYARKIPGLQKFIYFSTDEIFGPAKIGQQFKEWDRYNSCNPYSATKAGGEELSLAWANTYGVPVVITHTMNVYGERQHPEKYVPKVIRTLLDGETLDIHVDPETNEPGFRNYLHCQDVSEAVMFILKYGLIRDKFNITGMREYSNLYVAEKIANILGKTLKYHEIYPKTVRPGFDVRYGMDGSKLAAMGWSPSRSLDENLQKTVEWAIRPENRHWLYLEKN